jgi:hypothetical protein
MSHRIRQSPLLILILTFLLPIPTNAQPLRGTPGTTDLQPGIPVVRTIGRGQVQRFRVALRQEEFAQIAVDQRGIDVMVLVASPDGSPPEPRS